MRPIGAFGRQDLRLRDKLMEMSWGFVLAVCLLAAFGLAMLYSAGHGSANPWMTRQAARFVIALALMLALAFTEIGAILRIAYGLYAAAFLGLVFVEVAGQIGMGAQRWIDLGAFQVQPSEIMKI